MKICFYSYRYQNKIFWLVSHSFFFYVALLSYLRRACASRALPVSHSCRSCLTHFETNEVLCLPNIFVFFINQKQPLKCVWQNSYLDLRSYILYIIWQGGSYFTRNLSRAFFNALTSAQKLHWRTIIFEELLPDDYFCVEIWSQYYYKKEGRKCKTILIWRSCRKMNKNKSLLVLYYLWKKLIVAEMWQMYSMFFI